MFPVEIYFLKTRPLKINIIKHIFIKRQFETINFFKSYKTKIRDKERNAANRTTKEMANIKRSVMKTTIVNIAFRNISKAKITVDKSASLNCRISKITILKFYIAKSAIIKTIDYRL